MSACDSGCIDASSSGLTSVRSYTLQSAPTYFSEDINDFAVVDGFSSYQGICTNTGKSQNPLTYSLRDYWYNTSLIYNTGYSFTGSATGSAYFCGMPDEVYEKEALYTFDYLNSKFIKFGSSSQVGYNSLNTGDKIYHWYDTSNNIRISADESLNRFDCAGDAGYLFVDFNEGSSGDRNDYTSLSITSSAVDLPLNDSATSGYVRKGCLLELYQHGGGLGAVLYMAYPTASEWPPYHIYSLKDLIFRDVNYDGNCEKVNGIRRGSECISTIAVEAIDPSLEVLPGESCRGRVVNDDSFWFPRYSDIGNEYLVTIPVGGSRVTTAIHENDKNDSDYVHMSRNCTMYLFDHEDDWSNSYGVIKHPLDYTSYDYVANFDPSLYYNVLFTITNQPGYEGASNGANIAGKGNDNPTGMAFNDTFSSYKAYQDPDWVGSTNTFYPTLDKANKGIKFDGDDDEVRLDYSSYPNVVGRFDDAYSVYFYFKATTKGSGDYTLYSVLEGDSTRNQRIGDSLYIGADEKLYFAYDNNVYLLDDQTNFFSSEHEVLIMRTSTTLSYMLDGQYDNLTEITLNSNSGFDDMGDLRSVTIGNIVAYNTETSLLDVVPNAGFAGYIKDFQIFTGDLNYEERVDFATEQQGKWDIFSCNMIGTPSSIRMRIGQYVSDEPAFGNAGEFNFPDLSTFYTYNDDDELEAATSVSQINGQNIYFRVQDPIIDMCEYESTSEVEEEYANNYGSFSVLFTRTRQGGGGVIGNLYSIVVKPIERVLGHDFFKAFFDRVVGSCNGDRCTSPLFRRLLNMLLSLYVSMTAISMLFGLEKIGKYELMRRIILIGTIFTIFSPKSWYYFNFYIIYFFQNGAMDLSQLVTNSIFGTSGNYSTYSAGVITSNQDASGIFEPLEYVSEIIVSEDIHMKILSLLFSPPFMGFIMIVMTYYSFFIFFHIAFKVMVAYASILVIMATGIVISPFYFLMLLFKITSSFYEKWLSLMIGSAMQIIILACTVTFFSWIIYGLLATIFNYAVCWGVVWECCNNIPGLNITLLEFYIPSGYDLMLGRFGYDNIISSSPDFMSIALILVFMYTFKAFIEFSLTLGSKIGGASGGITGGVGQMMNSIDRGFRDKTVMGGLKNIEKGLDEVSGGKITRAKNSAYDSFMNNTTRKLDNLIGHKTVEKKALVDKIQGTIKEKKMELLKKGEFDPQKREEFLKKGLRDSLSSDGKLSAKQIDKIMNSKGVNKDINKSKSIDVKADTEKLIREAMNKDAGTGKDDNVRKAKENIAKAIRADMQQKVESGKSVESADKKANSRLEKASKRIAKVEREFKREDAAEKAENSARFSKTAARLKSKAGSNMSNAASNIRSKMNAPDKAQKKVKKDLKDDYDKS